MTGNQLRIFKRGLDVGGNFKKIRGARVGKPWWDMIIKRWKEAELRRVPSGSLTLEGSGEALRKFKKRDILEQITLVRTVSRERRLKGRGSATDKW